MTSINKLAEPELIAVRGGWMAVSAPGSRIQIGTPPAETKDKAVEYFEEILNAWQSLSEPSCHSGV